MTDQDLALRLLDRNCFDLDPKRPFIMTSPLSGWAHGGYQFRLRNGNEVFQYFPKARNTAYTEFGVPGIANKKLLERIIPAKELFPPHPGIIGRHGTRSTPGMDRPTRGWSCGVWNIILGSLPALDNWLSGANGYSVKA